MLILCIPSSLSLSILPIQFPTQPFIHPSPPELHREEECEDVMMEEEEEEEEEEETPVTESDSDEQEGADSVTKLTTLRYFRTWW